jgi:site-specific DNA-methyltransferase (adenine-specific)
MDPQSQMVFDAGLAPRRAQDGLRLRGVADGAVTPYYQHGGLTIYHGDARIITAWVMADVLVTDPPYGMSYRSGWLPRPIAEDHNTDVRDYVLRKWGNRPALVFGRWDQPIPVKAHLALTWDKGNWPGMGDLSMPWGPSTENIYVLGRGFNGKRSGSVIRINRITGRMWHPNEKPTALIQMLIQWCPPGMIADPFMGSGTTLVAAKNLGRQAIGIECEERYCEIAARRLAQEVFEL